MEENRFGLWLLLVGGIVMVAFGVFFVYAREQRATIIANFAGGVAAITYSLLRLCRPKP